MNITKMSDKKLIVEVKGLYDAIYNVDCFGSNDVLLYEKICRELERRGYCQAHHEIWIRKNNHAKESCFSLLLSKV